MCLHILTIRDTQTGGGRGNLLRAPDLRPPPKAHDRNKMQVPLCWGGGGLKLKILPQVPKIVWTALLTISHLTTQK